MNPTTCASCVQERAPELVSHLGSALYLRHYIDCMTMNRVLLVVRSRTNKSIELSRGVGTAPAYGESKGFVGVEQVKIVG